MKPYQSFQRDLIHHLKDKRLAIAYLNAALEAGDKKAFLLALRNVAVAQGNLSKLARAAKVNRVSLYKMMSKQGNPELGSIISLLNVFGMRLKISSSARRPRSD